jgi:transaldolase
MDCGQSYWLDNLTRKKISSGELKERAEKHGLRGVTSNPAIFHKAITKSQDYDADIQKYAKEGLRAEAIYEKLVIQDIQDACDALKFVYEQSKGLDGFVSLEVSPHLAHHSDFTMEEARRLFKEVDRPNCFIKIPGTKAGIPAIEQMLYEGININITLLFSVERYEEVAKAYIRALQRRAEENLPIEHLSSVASFFLSRIDVLCDQLLHHRILPKKNELSELAKSLMGSVAIANAKMAYQSFLQIFSGSSWEKLVQKGARVQRPLWASTSTKNPDYSDVMYVDPLIAKNTVNTMPDETIDAFGDHGKVVCDSAEQNIKEARETLEKLQRCGIDLHVVTERLVDEGIQKFIDPYDELIKSIQEKI